MPAADRSRLYSRVSAWAGEFARVASIDKNKNTAVERLPRKKDEKKYEINLS